MDPLYVGCLKGFQQQFSSPFRQNDTNLKELGFLAARPRGHDHHHRRAMVLLLEKAQAVAKSLSSHHGRILLEKREGRWTTVAHSRDLVLRTGLGK